MGTMMGIEEGLIARHIEGAERRRRVTRVGDRLRVALRRSWWQMVEEAGKW